ncbi:MAG: hypothetical protein CVV44_15465 [Spirochaetae bacterium HGW-Spirochaetae-1]|jgi:hypothetical protein|nr:MAG: hypothetical protein CVV44_15465 [Spirochaetae bacterium HGW-Spirochaetae-1]
MKKTTKKTIIPDLTEFIDEEGKKWVQTSTDDLFSMKEFNEILESIEKDKDKGEIVLARINFQKVNKEYYETALALKSKLDKQTQVLRKVITESTRIIDRKNKKLNELIEYIKKLHYFIANLQGGVQDLDKVSIFTKPVEEKKTPEPEIHTSIYEDVEEIIIPLKEDINGKVS